MIDKITINGTDIVFYSQRDAELVGGALQMLAQTMKERDRLRFALEEIRDGDEPSTAEHAFDWGRKIADIRDHAENALKALDATERSEGEPK